MGGTLPVLAPATGLARCPVYDPRGERVAYYDKIHLFDVQVNGAVRVITNPRRTAAGRAVMVVTPFGKLGLASATTCVSRNSIARCWRKVPPCSRYLGLHPHHRAVHWGVLSAPGQWRT